MKIDCFKLFFAINKNIKSIKNNISDNKFNQNAFKIT